MTKEYRSASHVAFNVTLPSGVRRHISFMQMTGGGSMFVTDDAELQAALEKHSFYKTVFFLSATTNIEPGTQVSEISIKEQPVEEKKAEEPKATTVKVACLDDAKEYLCDRYSYSRTKLRSKTAILEAAKEQGIIFEGLE